MFGNFRLAFGQFLENLPKVVENLQKMLLSACLNNKQSNTCACRYGISLLMFNFISQLFVALTCKILS